MLPRKRLRPNPTASSRGIPTAALSPETSPLRASAASDQAAGNQKTPQSKPATGDCKTPMRPKKPIHKTQSWSGSWPRASKASPSTSIARETISGGTVRPTGSSLLGRFDFGKDDARSLGSVRRESSAPPRVAETKAKPLVDTMKDDQDMTPQSESREEPAEPPSTPATQPMIETPPIPEPGKVDEGTGVKAVEEVPDEPSASSGWLSWWSRSTPTMPPNPPLPNPTHPVPQPEPEIEPEREEPRQEARSGEAKQEEAKKEENVSAAPENVSGEPPGGSGSDPASAGWFSYLPSMSMLPSVPGFGYGYKSAPAEENDASVIQPIMRDTDATQEPVTVTELTMKTANSKEPPIKDTKSDTTPNDKPEDTAAKDNSDALPPPKAGSTWAFWSRDAPAKGKAVEAAGEIAVIGEGSEAQPTPMSEDDVSSPAKDNEAEAEAEAEAKAVQPSAKSMWRRGKRHRPLSLDVDSLLSSSPESVKAMASNLSSSSAAAVSAALHAAEQMPAQVRPDAKKVKEAAAAEALAQAQQKPNLLLPSFSSTYRMKENPSILRQITNMVLRSSEPPPNHVFRVQEAPRIRKAIAIGVHGFFPATYLRPMMGQPTGTSLRFAGLAAEAIRRWVDANGSADCEIEKVALEGEGRINDRVDNLWKLMLNWVEHIRQADLIIMACHSQGVPVGVMLLQKLIDLGIVTHARIGVCAMAGVSLGPFPEYRSSILMGSAAELWEFGNPQSNNSRRFELSLKRVLDYGARITLIGSIDDQVVPMESAVYSPANHPYIYRAVFIDGRVHAPDFIAHLVGFALKLRNLGISDHGLIRELSVALAGSLYSGEGHSRLYYDDAVYDLAITHALETSDTAVPTACHIPRREASTAAALASSNPYVLPWIMRGLLEERLVKTELSAETEELLRQFDDWKPTNKALKDVKYRLEAVRSKL